MFNILKSSALVILASLPLIGGSGCREQQSNPGSDLRILLMAVDGLEWDVMLPMVGEGRLPNMRRLMEDGTFGLLESFEPTLSPAIWTTVATGKDRKLHGIRSFETKDREAPGGKRFYNSTDRKTKAFWNILTDYDTRVNMVGWFVTFPAENINGVMVAQAGTHDTEEVKAGTGIHKPMYDGKTPQQVHPVEQEDEVLKLLNRNEADIEQLTREIFGTFPYPMAPTEDRLWKASHLSFRADSTYAAIAKRLAVENDYDLMAMYIGGTDTVAHRFWRHMNPDLYKHRPSPDQMENFGDVIRKYYAYVDRVLGDIVKAAGPDITVILISDHGMHEAVRNIDNEFRVGDRMPTLVSGDHRDAPPGVLMAAGPGIRSVRYEKPIDTLAKTDLRMMGSVFDITPTLLVLLGIPVGQDMQGSPAESVIDAGFLAEHPVTTVPTHDTRKWEQMQRARIVVGVDSKEYNEQIRGIGYIGDDNDPSQEKETDQTDEE